MGCQQDWKREVKILDRYPKWEVMAMALWRAKKWGLTHSDILKNLSK